jgi:hypothetical protein
VVIFSTTFYLCIPLSTPTPPTPSNIQHPTSNITTQSAQNLSIHKYSRKAGKKIRSVQYITTEFELSLSKLFFSNEIAQKASSSRPIAHFLTRFSILDYITLNFPREFILQPVALMQPVEM